MLTAVVSLAALLLEVSQNPNPAPGLMHFTISVVGDGENVVTVLQVKIDGATHQVWAVQTDRSALPDDLTPPLAC